jgi:Tol biopolymer transport system component
MDVSDPGNVRRLTEAIGVDWWPAWCGDDTIVFERSDDPANPLWMEIATIDIDRPDTVPLLTSSSMPLDSDMNGSPSCSADGRFLTLSSLSQDAERANEFMVGVVDLLAASRQFDLIGDGYALGGHVSWSPDGRSVVFMHYESSGSNFQIYRVDLSNPTSYINLSSDFDGNNKYPAWSPTGDQIAFVCSTGSGEDRIWSLCLTPANSSRVSMILENLHEGTERESRSAKARHAITPSWSPDGRWIAFSSDQDGDWDIYIYSLDTGRVSNLTDDWPGDEMHPSWGPG